MNCIISFSKNWIVTFFSIAKTRELWYKRRDSAAYRNSISSGLHGLKVSFRWIYGHYSRGKNETFSPKRRPYNEI
jgi:hypothetical protein